MAEDADSFRLKTSRISITVTHVRRGIVNVVFMYHPKSISDRFHPKSLRNVCVLDAEIISRSFLLFMTSCDILYTSFTHCLQQNLIV